VSDENVQILEQRQAQVLRADEESRKMKCDKHSLAGSVSQRACVFCGSRVVLYPIADALHVVHGPVGCAAYTWDIRGAWSSGPQLHRNSFSTDLREMDVIYGGEKKLKKGLGQLIDRFHPKAAFVYGTCIVGIIGDDIDAICKAVEKEKGIPVIPVHSEGFKGTKKDGYRAACDAVYRLIGTGDTSAIPHRSINILGDFNIAGEVWTIKKYFERLGIQVVSCITGDGRVDEIRRAHGASFNLVQCAGSMNFLAKRLEEDYGIPFTKVSFFGIEDVSDAIYATAKYFDDPDLMERAADLVREELSKVYPVVRCYRKDLEGKKAALYVGGAFKAFSLVRALRMVGMKPVLVGTQTGGEDDYEELKRICDPDTVIVDDSNPVELAKFILEKDVDLFIGGVKERPIAYKLGVGFCDHNHERKIPLAGFDGMLSFIREVHASVMSPVWKYVPRRAQKRGVIT